MTRAFRATKAGAQPPVRFEGFADRTARFFRALVRNQRRDWFELHRQEYERGWLEPMKALLDEVRDRIDPLFPQLPLARPKVFRIHRDVRFSRDKSPYKTHIGGYIAVQGEEQGPSAAAPLYLHIGATERFVCAGQYMMDAAQLARFRAAVADDRTGERLATILGKLTRAGFVVGSQEQLRKVPRRFDPGHRRADLLRRKGLIVAFPTLPAALLVDRRLVEWLVGHIKRVVPLVEWIAALPDS